MTIPDYIINRKGANKKNLIPPEVLDLINTAQIETKNLTEYLVADKKKILEVFLKEQGIIENNNLENFSALSGLSSYAEYIYSLSIPDIITKTQVHKSDIVRSFGCYLVPLVYKNQSLDILLNNIKIFAQDSNAGVREIAWTAVRHPYVSENIKKSFREYQEICLGMYTPMWCMD